MKTMTRNAREHNINKVMQELTAAGLHIDNEASLKKIVNQNVKDCYKNELNKKIETVYFTYSRFFSINVKFQLPNQWFWARAYLEGGETLCHAHPLFFDSAFQ